MHPMLRRVRRTAHQKLLSAAFLCLVGLAVYLAALTGGGWWIVLLFSTAVHGLDARLPEWFLPASAASFGLLVMVEWMRRRRKSLQPPEENISWLQALSGVLLLGPGCLFSLWDLSLAAFRIAAMDVRAVEDVLGTMGPGGSVRISKLNGLLALSSRHLEKTIHAMQLLDLVYLAERNGALVLVATEGPGSSLCRTFREA